jgi:riboflavin kinase/FMN adenylyltransferase
MDVDLDFLASSRKLESSVIGIGVFDGVHLAHQRLIERVVRRARALNVHSCILTFEPHPQEVLGGKTLPRLSSLSDRLAQIECLGTGFVKVIRFTREFSRTSAEEFVHTVLVRRLSAREVIIGFNFTFGRGGAGTAGTLAELGRQHGFGVETVGAVEVDGQTVSSSSIRTALTDGAVHRAARFLGRPYSIAGAVRAGSGRGRTLGFPTANLAPDPESLLLPRRGVYRGQAQPGGTASYPALINVGTRPTFDGASTVIVPEVYLHGFDGDLVGRSLRVTFLERLRDERKFPSVDGLVAQIREDLETMLSRLEQARQAAR